MPSFRIILTDDHEIMRAGLKGLIDKESGLSVVGEAGDGQQLMTLLNKTKCDCIVLDLSMPNMDGMQAIKEIRKKFPKVKILILTMQKDSEHFRHAMNFGASGYVLKDDAYHQLVVAIKTVLRDKQYISPAMANLTADRYLRSMDDVESPSLEILTRREQQVLKFIAKGMANKNIAAKLNISVRTVETHRTNLTNKLGIKSTAGLVKFAISKGWS